MNRVVEWIVGTTGFSTFTSVSLHLSDSRPQRGVEQRHHTSFVTKSENSLRYVQTIAPGRTHRSRDGDGFTTARGAAPQIDTARALDQLSAMAVHTGRPRKALRTERFHSEPSMFVPVLPPTPGLAPPHCAGGHRQGG